MNLAYRFLAKKTRRGSCICLELTFVSGFGLRHFQSFHSFDIPHITCPHRPPFPLQNSTPALQEDQHTRIQARAIYWGDTILSIIHGSISKHPSNFPVKHDRFSNDALLDLFPQRLQIDWFSNQVVIARSIDLADGLRKEGCAAEGG